MFQRETHLNQFLMGYLDKVVADIPNDRIAERGAGGGHPPVWILGHLAIVGEMGQMLLGGALEHPEWFPIFGPGSSDEVQGADRFSKNELIQVIHTAYPKVCELAAATPPERLEQPHGFELLNDTAISTVGDLTTHGLTAHFAFHLAQLSAWRRADGKGPIM
ncbi:DinB family protein [Aeoliella sp. ICT_H6.2]|uniref:DinB family protein n=1 Tax=Aeoliella straminimaris TaxID=2954799 RepID=A0A9X2JGN2_9BACT|nr:DinB family protein [Aeoliella straminimaris]MCO6044921.1 DinB family protein [Aeoliella straminimaris]